MRFQKFLNLFSVKPNFLGIGAAKCGTTKLARLLMQHPEVFIPDKKELHFFDNDKYLGAKNKNCYFSQFKKNTAIGEITPSYIFMPQSPVMIRKLLGKNIKFIIALRNPVERAYSHYCHAVNGWAKPEHRRYNYPIENLTFEEALAAENYRLKNEPYHIRHLSYFSKGLYAEQIKRYFNHFHRDNFFIYLLEDFIENPEDVMKNLCIFLKINQEFKFKDLKSKLNSQTSGSIKHETRVLLTKLYADSISELEILLNRDLSDWKSI